MNRLAALVAALVLAPFTAARAQDNYEIQVYPSETVEKGMTMFEFHTNYTADGRTTVSPDGMLPTNHAIHETLEITHGFTPWFEIGFYTFTSTREGTFSWVGNHIRPRFSVPADWHWPVGVSLSQEIGYQRAEYSSDTWTWEIRPIVDKQIGRLYVSLNPTLELSLKGPSAGQSPGFSPNAAVTFDVTRQVNLGIEYYGAYGPLGGFDAPAQREQQIFPAINLNLSPDWEFNAGVGFGLTGATDHLIFKTIVGRRFH
ncbi:MAG: hypothetical protein ACHQX4_07455 [Gemmatimonadales bacterium]